MSGRALANTLVRIDGGPGVVTTRAAGDGSFSVEVPLFINRLNRLYISSSDSAGHASAPIPLDLLEDSQAPSLYVDFPPANSQVSAETVVIAGRVGDMLSGFMGLEVEVRNLTTESPKVPANVIVGIGQNGTYERGNVALQLGGMSLK